MVQGGRPQGQTSWNQQEHRTREHWREGGKSNSSVDVKCFHCLQMGHHQADFLNEPVCKYKQDGHMAVDCKSSESKKLEMFGFGIPGQGFYTLNFPEAKVKVS